MTVAQGTPRTDALKTYLREKYPDTFFGQLKDVYYMEAAELFAQECVMLEAENAALSAQVVELQQQLVNSSVTRAQVPPSISDGGTQKLFQSALDMLERDCAKLREILNG